MKDEKGKAGGKPQKSPSGTRYRDPNQRNCKRNNYERFEYRSEPRKYEKHRWYPKQRKESIIVRISHYPAPGPETLIYVVKALPFPDDVQGGHTGGCYC